MKVLTVTLHPALDRIVEVERFSFSEPVSSRLVKMYAAGKGINAARTLHRLGVDVLALSFQGGRFGETLMHSIREEGIPSHFIKSNSPTRITTVVYEKATGKRFTLYEPRQVATKSEADFLLEYFLQSIGRYDLCLLCGAGEGIYFEKIFYEMIGNATKKGIPCLVDSSGLALANAVKARPLFVKVNLEELSRWAGRRIVSIEEQRAALKDMISNHTRFAAVSNREKGLIALNGVETWRGKFSFGEIINTIGCGDAMLAGIAFGLLRQMPMSEIVQYGVACGTANTQNIGAGFVSPDMVHEIHKKVMVHSLD